MSLTNHTVSRWSIARCIVGPLPHVSFVHCPYVIGSLPRVSLTNRTVSCWSIAQCVISPLSRLSLVHHGPVCSWYIAPFVVSSLFRSLIATLLGVLLIRCPWLCLSLVHGYVCRWSMAPIVVGPLPRVSLVHSLLCNCPIAPCVIDPPTRV